MTGALQPNFTDLNKIDKMETPVQQHHKLHLYNTIDFTDLTSVELYDLSIFMPYVAFHFELRINLFIRLEGFCSDT